MTFTAKLRNLESYLESYLESLEVLEPSTIQNMKQALKHFSRFCKSKYNELDEEIISELMKQKKMKKSMSY